MSELNEVCLTKRSYNNYNLFWLLTKSSSLIILSFSDTVNKTRGFQAMNIYNYYQYSQQSFSLLY